MSKLSYYEYYYMVAGLGFCTPSRTDQRQLGVFSGLKVQAFRFWDFEVVEVFRRFRGSVFWRLGLTGQVQGFRR